MRPAAPILSRIRRPFRFTVGLAVWFCLGAWAWNGFGREFFLEQAGRPAIAKQLWEYSARPSESVGVVYPTSLLTAIGDPVFVYSESDGFLQVGFVERLDDDSTANGISKAYVESVRIRISGLDRNRIAQSELLYYRTPDNMAWVLETMLPPARRAQIARELNQAIQEHQAQIVAELKPIIRDSMRDVVFVLEKQLRASLLNRRDEIEQLGGRYQRELIDKEIVPLVREQIWPIVLEHGQPVANEIGLDIWERVSVWRFTWRYLADLTPLTRKKRFEEEWNRFVRQEAIPELERHSDQLITVVKDVLSDAARNRKIQDAFRQNLKDIIDDPALQRIVWRIMQDVLSDPEPWREVMEKHWNSPATRAAFQIAADRLEPAAQRIGEQLLGTPDGGITPEFAQVLRNRILFKDRRWYVLQPVDRKGAAGTSSTPHTDATTGLVLKVRAGGEPLASPFIDESDDEPGDDDGSS